MKNTIRFFFTLWVLGTVFTLINGRPGWFNIIGLSNVDIFNSKSLKVAEYRMVYYRIESGKKILLPFMSPDGSNLKWFTNENFKYRTYLISAFIFRNSADSLNFNSSKTRVLFMRPALYDFCREGFTEMGYELLIQYRSEVRSRVLYDIKQSLLTSVEQGRCRKVHERLSLL